MLLGIWILDSIREFLWRCVARVVTIPRVTDWLIARAQLTPYTPIKARDGSGDIYMVRLWLFNPYPSESDKEAWEAWGRSWRRFLPSMRIHHILRADDDEHPHDHPWNARTIVARNGYQEERPTEAGRATYWRGPGYTGRLLFGQYHRISYVPEGGAWTLFITWRYQGTWGFLVDGKKVPWRTYLGLEPKS